MPSDLVKLQRSPRDIARWQKAQQQVVGERHAAALASYRDLVRQYPGVEQLWFELGLAATGDLEFKTAQEAFSRAEQLAGKDASFQVLLGQQFHRLRRLDRARACFERAVQADPAAVHAQLSLAAWYERERRLDDAWNCVEACLTKHPRNPQALCLKALLLHRKKQNPEAEALLRDLIKGDSGDPNVKISSRHLLGTVLDQLGEYEEALRWICESKKLLTQTANVARMEQDYDRADRHRRELLCALTPERMQRWRAQAPATPLPNRMVLLGGHPRSGTTLLEQILGAHPAIVALDEPEAFVQEVWQCLAPIQATRPLTIAELDTLRDSQLARMRERYWKSLWREIDGDLPGKVLLDKNPSPTAALHLWLRVFPELKVVIALRDPRDVVLSCFFQNLMLTPANANFLSLERTAKHYADLMDVWLRMRELGGFDWAESRYEDLVQDPEAEGRKVTLFCGLDWDAQQASHHEAARNKVLFAPTFSDVAQPVHQRAVGRWQHYAEALAPLQDRLSRYCRAFGYGTG
jgi:Flp pilus assembly protein TadD